jgi:beta-xylosidase
VATAAIGPTFTNPVFGAFADPMALDVGNAHSDYYAFATGGNFPMAHSSDLVHWTSAGTAMSGRPAWAQQTGDYNPWAPSVIETADPCPGATTGRCFVMYFVSKHASMDPPANCIGVATSSAPGGPFADRGPLQNAVASVDSSGRPIGCGDDGGYSNIDPAPFVDDGGSAYLYLSTGHRCPAPAPHTACDWDRTISVIPLSADLLTAAGPRQPLFASGAPWEASVVEGPWMRKRAGVYELFYSGGAFTGAYGMGYATASSPAGPFVKSDANPLLHDSADVKSAGGGSLVTGPGGGQWVAYHGRAGSYAAGRVLRMDHVRTGNDGAVAIDGPTSTPQPVP